jgi:hypothetical protein
MAATLYTREEARELLELEGWAFIGIDDRSDDEPGDVPDGIPDEYSEIWRRQIGGRVEWCSLDFIWPLPPEIPPERCWHRAMYDFDPRTIED